MSKRDNTDDLWGNNGFSDDQEDLWAEGFAIPVPKLTRTDVARFNDWDAHPFTILMNDHRVYDPHSYHGKKFRRTNKSKYNLLLLTFFISSITFLL